MGEVQGSSGVPTKRRVLKQTAEMIEFHIFYLTKQENKM